MQPENSTASHSEIESLLIIVNLEKFRPLN